MSSKNITLAAEHAHHRPLRVPVRQYLRTEMWNARYAELRGFRASFGRMPYASTADPTEASLGRWLARQRYALSQGRLDDVRQRQLDELGEWRQPARTYRDAKRWKLSLEDLVTFRSRSNRLPSYKHYSDEAERRLGIWLHHQRQAASAGTLTSQRVADLDAAVPGWNTWRARG